jgi:hypothetical protein
MANWDHLRSRQDFVQLIAQHFWPLETGCADGIVASAKIIFASARLGNVTTTIDANRTEILSRKYSCCDADPSGQRLVTRHEIRTNLQETLDPGTLLGPATPGLVLAKQVPLEVLWSTAASPRSWPPCCAACSGARW